MSSAVNDLMAECMDMVRQDLIAAGVIAASVPPMMVSDAVIAKAHTQTARIAELEDELKSMTDIAGNLAVHSS